MLKQLNKSISTEKKNIAITVLLSFGMMLALYALLGIYPFGDGTVLTGDLNGQYINYFSHYKRAFLGDSGFFYGFDKSLGGSLLGLFAYYVSSPLNLAYLLVSTIWSPVVSSLLLLVKIVAACGIFQFYIGKKYGNLGATGVAVSLCYGFMAYGFAYAQNIMWHDVILLLPLICYGIDLILAEKSNLTYTIVLAAAIFANFYIAYMACLFAVLYFLYSIVIQNNRKGYWKKPIFSFVGGSLLGGGLPMFLLLPALANAGSSKGGLFSYQFSAETNFPLLRFPERFFWGSFVWQDVVDGMPQVYCGLLVLLLVGAYFFSDKITKREKIASGSMIAILVLSFWIKGLDVIWHGLKPAVWFPFRNSYLLCFFLAMIAATAVAKKVVEIKAVVKSFALLALISGAYIVFPGSVGRKKMLLGIVVMAGYALCLLWEKLPKPTQLQHKKVRLGVKSALLFVVVLELSGSAFFISNKFEKYPLSVFQQFVRDNTATVEEINGRTPENFRLEKNFQRSFNDSMLIGNRGISHFGSTQDDNVVKSLAGLGYRNYGLSNGYFNGSTAFADSILGIGYLYSAYDDTAHRVPAHYETKDWQLPYQVYENPYVLPAVFAVTGEAEPANNWKLNDNPFEYQDQLYAQITGTSNQLFVPVEKNKITDIQGKAVPLAGLLPIGVEYRISVEQEGYYYMYAQAESGRFYSLPVTIDGEAAEQYFTAEQYGVMNLGYRQKGDTIQLAFNNQEEVHITQIYFSYCTQQDLQQLRKLGMENAAEKVEIRDGYARIEINATESEKWLFTSIPFDTGWQVTVNGARVEPQTMGKGFLAVPLVAGKNSVEMHYQPALAKIGVAISLFCLVALIAVQVIKKRRKTTI